MKLMSLLHERLSSEDQDADVLGPVRGMVENVTRFHPALIASADASLGFVPQVNEPLIQAYGSVNKRGLAGPWGARGDDGVYGSYVEGSSVRIERVVDPDDSAKRCWWMRLHADDPDTAGSGSKRTEFSYSKVPSRIVQRQRFVIGISVRLGDWRAAKDNQAVWQIHADDGVGGSPWLALYVQGARASISARFNPTSPRTNPKQTVHEILHEEDYVPHAWVRWVIEVVEDFAGAGRALVLRNGVRVCDYRGRLGYDEGAGASYLKTGIYHWTSQNTWAMSVPLRECWQKGAYIARGGAITPEMMDAFLASI